jgi:hypothetical protein
MKGPNQGEADTLQGDTPLGGENTFGLFRFGWLLAE